MSTASQPPQKTTPNLDQAAAARVQAPSASAGDGVMAVHNQAATVPIARASCRLCLPLKASMLPKHVSANIATVKASRISNTNTCEDTKWHWNGHAPHHTLMGLSEHERRMVTEALGESLDYQDMKVTTST
jgi:hypothetical protein